MQTKLTLRSTKSWYIRPRPMHANQESPSRHSLLVFFTPWSTSHKILRSSALRDGSGCPEGLVLNVVVLFQLWLELSNISDVLIHRIDSRQLVACSRTQLP